MKTYQLQSHINQDGQLKVDIQTDLVDCEVEVLLVIQTKIPEQLLESEAYQTMLASEDVLAKTWNTPEEDEAWQNL